MAKLDTVIKKQALAKSKREAVAPTKDRKGGRLTKGMWKYLLNDAKDLIEQNEYDILSDLKLSQRWGVSRATVPRIKEVIAVETEDVLPFIKQKFLKHFNNIEEDLIEMHYDLKNNKYCTECKIIVQGVKCPKCDNKYLDKNYKGKLTLAREIPALMKEYTDFLERFGLKDKIAEKVDIQADITQRSLNVQVITNGAIPNNTK